jgi:hypothetical protein
MMCQMRDMYRLVDNEVIALSRDRMGVCDHTANGLIVLGAKRRVEPCNFHGSVIVLDDEGISSKDAGVSVGVEFKRRVTVN